MEGFDGDGEKYSRRLAEAASGDKRLRIAGPPFGDHGTFRFRQIHAPRLLGRETGEKCWAFGNAASERPEDEDRLWCCCKSFFKTGVNGRLTIAIGSSPLMANQEITDTNHIVNGRPIFLKKIHEEFEYLEDQICSQDEDPMLHFLAAW